MDLIYFPIAVLCITVMILSLIAMGFLLGMEHEYQATRKARLGWTEAEVSRLEPDENGWFPAMATGHSPCQPKD